MLQLSISWNGKRLNGADGALCDIYEQMQDVGDDIDRCLGLPAVYQSRLSPDQH